MTSLAPLLELTFTSFDSQEAERGGWQVKEVQCSPALDPGARAAWEEELRRHIRWELRPTTPAPKFPSRDDLDGRTRRLVHRQLGETLHGLWHTVEAGADASGRPGNVFVHALLCDAPPDVRFVDTWRSGDWLVPYGAPEVARATIGGPRQFALGDELSSDVIVDFLTAPPPAPDRVRLLGAVLDATAHALSGESAHSLSDGPGVLLLADTADEAAMWIAAAAYFTSPLVANAITWSSFERAADLTDEPVRHLHVVAVPTADGAAAQRAGHGRIVVALDEEPAGERDEPWLLRSGHQVNRTPWSAVAMATLARDRHDAVTDLDALRSTGSDVAIAGSLRPGLALGLRILDDDPASYHRARALAQAHFGVDHLCEHRNDSPEAAAAYVEAVLGAPSHLRPGWLVPQIEFRLPPDTMDRIARQLDATGMSLANSAAALSVHRYSAESRPALQAFLDEAWNAALLLDFIVPLGRNLESSIGPGVNAVAQWAMAIVRRLPPEWAAAFRSYASTLDRRTQSQLEQAWAAIAVPAGRDAATHWTAESTGGTGFATASGAPQVVDPQRSWVEDAWQLGVVTTPNPGQQVDARRLLEGLGHDPGTAFMTRTDVLVRPWREQVALAVLASAADSPLAGGADQPPEYGWHLLLTSRLLLDAGADTAARLAGFAVATILGAALVAPADAEAAFDPRSPYGRLVDEVLARDGPNGQIRRLFVAPAGIAEQSWLELIRATAVGRYVEDRLRGAAPMEAR